MLLVCSFSLLTRTEWQTFFATWLKNGQSETFFEYQKIILHVSHVVGVKQHVNPAYLSITYLYDFLCTLCVQQQQQQKKNFRTMCTFHSKYSSLKYRWKNI